MKPYIVEYIDAWDCFDRTTVNAEDYEQAWFKIKQVVKPGCMVLRVYEPVFDGKYLVE